MSHACGPKCCWSCRDAGKRHDWSAPWEANPTPTEEERVLGLPIFWIKRCRGVCMDERNPHFRDRCSASEWVRSASQPDTKFKLHKLQGRVLG